MHLLEEILQLFGSSKSNCICCGGPENTSGRHMKQTNHGHRAGFTGPFGLEGSSVLAPSSDARSP